MSAEAGHFRPRRGVAAQAVLLSGAAAVSQLATAAIYIIVARRSDPADFGVVIAAVAAGMTVAGLVDFGSNAYWVREIARGVETGRSLGPRMMGKIVSGLCLVLALSVIVAALAPSTRLWVGGVVGLGTLVSQTSRVPLTGIGQSDKATIPLVLERLLAAGLLWPLAETGLGFANALWVALVIGSLFSAVVAHLMTPKASRFGFRLRARQLPWRGARDYGMASGAVSAYSLDVTLLSAISSPVAAAVYGAVSRWTQPMALLANAFASSAAPFIAHSGEFTRALRQIRRALWLPAAAILSCLVIVALAPFAVHLLLGDAYRDAAAVLRLLAVASIPAVVNQVCLVALQSLGHDRAVARLIMGSAVLQLAMVCALAAGHGAVGAAVAVVVVQFLLMGALVTHLQLVRTRPAVVGSDPETTAPLPRLETARDARATVVLPRIDSAR